jgi:hypothetical protein
MSISPINTPDYSQYYTPPSPPPGGPKPTKGDQGDQNNGGTTPANNSTQAPSLNTSGQTTGQTVNTTA